MTLVFCWLVTATMGVWMGSTVEDTKHGGPTSQELYKEAKQSGKTSLDIKIDDDYWGN